MPFEAFFIIKSGRNSWSYQNSKLHFTEAFFKFAVYNINTVEQIVLFPKNWLKISKVLGMYSILSSYLEIKWTYKSKNKVTIDKNRRLLE